MIDTKSLRQVQIRAVAAVLATVGAAWATMVSLVTVEWASAVLALVLVVVPAAFVGAATTGPMAQRWALRRGVAFDERVLPQLHRHLLRTRLARTVGVAAGFATNGMLVAHYNADPAAFRWFVRVWNAEFPGVWLSGAGYVLATIWAELTKPREVTGSGGGVAVLALRRLRDFADAVVLRWLTAVALAAPAAAMIWWLAPEPSSPVRNRLREGAIVGSAVAAAVAVVAAVVICRRAERAGDDVAVAYEELTRSASVNALVGVAVAMCGSVVGEFLTSRVVTDWTPGWILPWVGGLIFVGSMSTWYGAGTSFVFRSRRMDALREGSVGVPA